MNNNKGFTLVELLAMLVVLGILMTVTIPNITGILNKSKENVIISDAVKMVESAKIKVVTQKRKLEQLNDGECGILSLDYLNSNEDIGKGPNDGVYLDYDSFVVYKLVPAGGGAKKYEYYVRLVEKKDNKYYGIELINADELEKDTTKPKAITNVYGSGEEKPIDGNSLGDEISGASCGGIKFYK